MPFPHVWRAQAALKIIAIGVPQLRLPRVPGRAGGRGRRCRVEVALHAPRSGLCHAVQQGTLKQLGVAGRDGRAECFQRVLHILPAPRVGQREQQP